MLRLAGLCGVIASLIGVFGVLAAVAACGPGCSETVPYRVNVWIARGDDGGFSWRSNALSDLGVTGHGWIFNGCLIIAGILSCLFILGFVHRHRRSGLIRPTAVLLLSGAVGLALVGVYTEESLNAHILVSAVYFIAYPLGMVSAGVGLLRLREAGTGYLSIGAGLSALAVIGSAYWFRVDDMLGVGFAVPEFIEALILAGWTSIAGMRLLRGL
ncbi:MAG: DUF998 domain-containing protein [Candidatus Altiarchaeota archaeon]